MAAAMQETEIKLRFESAAEARRRIEALGATLAEERHPEDNVLVDRQVEPLRASGRILRLRRTPARAKLTLKAPVPGQHRHKVREEHETGIGDADALLCILDALGFHPIYRYQKYRTVYGWGELAITVDETAIGCFVELEGPPPAIDDAAARLGFGVADYVRASYRDLHLEDAARRGVAPGDLLLP